MIDSSSMSRNPAIFAQVVSGQTSTLNLIHEGYTVPMTGVASIPIQCFATPGQDLIGPCATAAFLHPHDRVHPGKLRRTFAASLTFDGPRGAWPDRVCLKYVAGKAEVARLRAEANFYIHELRYLSGVAVPQFYGFFEGKNPAGSSIACMVLELCNSDRRAILDGGEFQ